MFFSNIARGVIRHLKVYANFIRIGFTVGMEYRANFITIFIIDIFWFLIPIVYMQAIYNNVAEIKGWTYYEMLFFLGTMDIIMTFNAFTLLANIPAIPSYITKGELDFVLLKPVNSQFYVSLRNINIGSFFNIVIGFCVVIYSLTKLNVSLSLVNIALYFIMIFNGYLLVYIFSFSMMLFSFVFLKLDTLYQLFEELIELSYKPADIYSGIVKFIVLYIIPFGVIVTFPAKVLLGKLSIYTTCISMLITCVLFFICTRLWKAALKKYTSASS